MIRRDEVLKTKRHELGNVVAGRKRKLRELYCATTTFHDAANPYRDKSTQSSPQLDQDGFLDANDITKGRRFDSKTLKLVLSTPNTAVEPSNHIGKHVQDVKHGQKVEGRLEVGAGVSSRQNEDKVLQENRQSTGARTTNSLLQENQPPADTRRIPALTDRPTTQSPTQYEKVSKTEFPGFGSRSISAISDPTSQLLSEAARGEVLEDEVSKMGTKRNYETAMQTSPVDTPSKARKEDARQLRRIDTNVLHNKRSSLPSAVESPAPLTAATPERMTTRVASGALRHRSVSEILGETPRLTPNGEKSANQISSQTPKTAAPLSTPQSAMFQSKLNELRDRERERIRVSTVVFPKQHTAANKLTDGLSEDLRRQEKIWEQKDYLMLLFCAQASPQNPKLSQLVLSAKKTLSTHDHRLDYREEQDCRILKRIYHLQNSNHWSLRQRERAKEPERPISHWDTVLGEAKWMRTDFREERRWKIAAAKNLADWCAEYVRSTEEDRRHLRTRVKKTRRRTSVANHTTPMSLNNASSIPPSAPTPDLIPSGLDDISDSADEDIPIDTTQGIAPSALFNLPPASITFDLQYTPATDKMLEELPLYKIWTDAKDSKKPYSAILDSRWKLPIAPVIKHATGKILLKTTTPVRRKTRFDYSEDDDSEHDTLGTSFEEHRDLSLLPEQDEVALFHPQNKHIVARLHAAHTFRPPSEFAMPSQGFFEARQPSQWLVSEDDQLRRLVREYEYNWSLISSCMCSKSSFSAGAERRTPWECFERWVSFEGLPGDMAKHQYFRAWNSRREAAKERLDQLYQAQLQNPTTSHLPPRRRTAEPVTVERRKQGKYISLFSIMSQGMKKREIALAKQQAAAAVPPKKTVPESADQRQAKMRTPREFSQHKHKQELEFRARRLQYHQEMMAQQRQTQMVAKAAQANGLPPPNQIPGSAGRAGMIQTNGTGHQVAASGVGNRMPSTVMSNLSNGAAFPGGGPMNMRQAVPTPAQMAQAAAFMQQQQHGRMTQQGASSRVMMEAVRLSEQQQRLAQQRQYHANGLNGAATAGFPNAMFSNMQAVNSRAGATSNGMTVSNRPSSSAGSANGLVGQQLSNGTVPVVTQVAGALQAQHPNATQEQILQLATMTLSKQLLRQQQNGAAAGGNAALQAQMAFGANGLNHQAQQYAALLRNQQYQQANQQGRAASAGRGGSPNDGSRPGSQGSAMMQQQGSAMGTTTQSPRPLSAQMTGSS